MHSIRTLHTLFQQTTCLGALALAGAAHAQDACLDNLQGTLTCSSVIEHKLVASPTYDTWWDDGTCANDGDWTPTDNDLGGYCYPEDDGFECQVVCDNTGEYGGECTSHITQEGPEDVWAFTCQRSGPVKLLITDMDCDLDIYVLEGECNVDACTSMSIDLDVYDDSVEFTCQEDLTYYVVIEGYGFGWAGWYTDRGYCDPMGIQGEPKGSYTLSFEIDDGGCAEDCGNGLDDDYDGNTDCDDDDCANDPPCVEIECDNRVDDDSDGLTDCDDPDCADDPTCDDDEPSDEDCANGLDDDQDGDVDCDDDDCTEAPACDDEPGETTETDCENGVDDDDDGDVDCDDADCDGDLSCADEPAPADIKENTAYWRGRAGCDTLSPFTTLSPLGGLLLALAMFRRRHSC